MGDYNVEPPLRAALRVFHYSYSSLSKSAFFPRFGRDQGGATRPLGHSAIRHSATRPLRLPRPFSITVQCQTTFFFSPPPCWEGSGVGIILARTKTTTLRCIRPFRLLRLFRPLDYYFTTTDLFRVRDFRRLSAGWYPTAVADSRRRKSRKHPEEIRRC